MTLRAYMKKASGVHRITTLQQRESGILAVPAPSRESVRNGDPDMIRFIQQHKESTVRVKR